MADIARQSRHMLTRVVRHLAGEAGIRQFLDIGTGLPTVDNTHEVAQRVAPTSRIVCVDNDPLVLVHAEALLVGTPQGATTYIEADVRDPDAILRQAAETLDFAQPVVLMLMGIMGLVRDEQDPRSIVEQLMTALPSGSYLALYDGSDSDPAYVAAIRGFNQAGGAVPYTPRSPQQIAEGPLIEAVPASCAVPGLPPPVPIGGEHFLDGGLVDGVPVGRALASRMRGGSTDPGPGTSGRHHRRHAHTPRDGDRSGRGDRAR